MILGGGGSPPFNGMVGRAVGDPDGEVASRLRPAVGFRRLPGGSTGITGFFTLDFDFLFISMFAVCVAAEYWLGIAWTVSARSAGKEYTTAKLSISLNLSNVGRLARAAQVVRIVAQPAPQDGAVIMNEGRSGRMSSAGTTASGWNG